jgi:hypothetical protein
VVNTFSFQKICKWYAEGKSNKVSRDEEKAGNKFKKKLLNMAATSFKLL